MLFWIDFTITTDKKKSVSMGKGHASFGGFT